MYRDDVEALYTRATMLEQELELAQRRLAERDREVSALRRGARSPEQGPPPIPALADADDILERLERDEQREAKITAQRPDLRVPNISPTPRFDRAKVLDRARDALDALDDEPLLMIGAVIETLGDEHDIRFEVYKRIVQLVRYIHEIRG